MVRILSCLAARGDLPGSGMEPRTPALAGDSLPVSQQGSLKLVHF